MIRNTAEKSKRLSVSCAEEIRSMLRTLANDEQAKILSKFFKTGPGEYGEGDLFWGIKVPQIRAIARPCRDVPLPWLEELLIDPVHECRLCAALAIAERYQHGDDRTKKSCYHFYLSHLKGINNWDLVDLTAPKIVGDYLLRNKQERKLLPKLAKSNNLWERRISIVATYPLIKNGQFNDTFTIAKMLLGDSHDLIHKAVGWMLREVGKIDHLAEESFLDEHCSRMPRTALRYAIERFPGKKRKYYLAISRKR